MIEKKCVLNEMRQGTVLLSQSAFMYNKEKQLSDEDDKVRKKTKFNRDLLHSDKG